MIAWAPAHDSYHVIASMRPGAAAIAPLHVTQRALLELSAQIDQRRAAMPFGLLSGSLCLSPETRTQYLVIDEVTAARRELTPEEPLEQLRTELRALASDAERLRKLPIGWYLGGMDDDLELDPEVAALHRQLFPEAWHVVLVAGQESGAQRGAFQRFESLTDRFYAIAFSELLPESGRRGDAAEARTALRWTNYRSAYPVSPLDTSAVADIGTGSRASRARELDLGSFVRFLRRRAEPSPMDGASPTADAPPPPAPTPPPATAPARRLDISRPISTSAQSSPVRRAAATTPEQTPPAPSAPPALSLAERAVAPPAPPPISRPEPAPATAPPISRAEPVRAALPPTVQGEPSPPVARVEAAPPEISIPQVFIDGALVPLPEEAMSIPQLPPTISAAGRILPMLLGTALIVLVASAVYLSFR